MSMNSTCAISSWISFLTSAGILVHLDMFATPETLKQRSRPSRSMIGDRPSQLAHCHPTHLFFLDSTVPVVQRKEQLFPKTRLSFHHTSSAIVSVTDCWLVDRSGSFAS